MSEKKKQTLFRFKTMRAPELLSSETKENYFIQHPDGTSGTFYAAVAGMGIGDTKKSVLSTAASSFTGKKTKAEILQINSDLAAFGLFLIKNRKKLTVADVNAEISGLTALSSGKELDLWDSLFYQTVTRDSGYARETILQLILANYFVNQFSGMATTDEAMQKWAGSRIVMPMELFEFEDKYGNPTTDNDLASGIDVLSHFAQAAEAKIYGEIIANAEKEVDAYKTDFLKTNNKAETAAIDAHISGVDLALAGATETDYVDQFTNYTFKKITNFNPPVYSYTRPAEVAKSAMGQVFSEETDYFLSQNNLYTTNTFEELAGQLEQASSDYTKSIFDRTAFSTEKISINGTLVSKCGIERRFNQKYAFMVKLVKKAANKYGAILVVDTGSDCLKLDTAIVNFKAPINAGFTARLGSTSKGVLSIDLLPGQSIDLTGETGIEVSGEVVFSNGTRLEFAKDLVEIGGFMSGVMTKNSNDSQGIQLDLPSGFGVTRLGISDYRKVEQTLCCYVPGEVAHIENVMAREYKERSTRRLRRSDDKSTVGSSSESESMTDTSTTTRFDMQKEVSKVISDSKDMGLSIGFNTSVSGTKKTGIGDIDFSAGGDVSTDFATSHSSEESNSQSTSMAKDITEKASQRVTSKVNEERVTRIIEEFEEKNQHGFDNRQGAEHVSGVYRWVDKIYKNEIYNYGKRLQYEFMIPEPAKFHLIAKASGVNLDNGLPLIKPLDPRKDEFGVLKPLRNSAHVKPDNYYQWACAYGAVVSPPPNKFLTVGKTLLKPDDGAEWHIPKTVKDDIIIPPGYGIESINFSFGGNKREKWCNFLISAAGVTRRLYEDHASDWLFAHVDAHPSFRQYSTTIPISAQFLGHDAGMVSFSVKLSHKASTMAEWQLKTYNAILSAYEDRLQEYKNQLASRETELGVQMGDNPAFHRKIENTVLRKNCLDYLAGHHTLGQPFTTGDEIKNNQVRLTEDMDRYSAIVKFFEQAFEWDVMDYYFYPFYWADKEKWSELYAMENDDHIFKGFLQAGMARTVVTVRPGFEEAVMFFMATGYIWNGGAVPVIGDDLYLSIVNELQEPEYTIEETWETRLPSTLTVIQAKTIGLDAEGLPCYCEEEEPLENLETPVVNPLTDLDVHIDGLNPPA